MTPAAVILRTVAGSFQCGGIASRTYAVRPGSRTRARPMQDALKELAEVLTEAGRFEELAQVYAERASSSHAPEERVEILVALASLLLERFDDPDQALRALLEALY